MKVKITDVRAANRVREDYGDVESLAASMIKLGQLQPIVLDENMNLLAGGRRLAAARINGWDEIEAVLLADVDPVTHREIELEENLRRKDLTWVEEIQALKMLYDLKASKYTGFPGEKPFEAQTLAKEFDKSAGSVSMDLQLAEALTRFPALADEKTKSAAFKRFKRAQETLIRTEQARRTREPGDPLLEGIINAPVPSEAGESSGNGAETVAPTPTRQPIKKLSWKGHGILYLADSLDVMKLYTPNSIDCLVTDPPYALGMFKEDGTTGNTRLAESAGHMYDDDPTRVMDMLDQIFMHAARILKPDGHAYIFFHHTKYEEMFLMLRKHFGTCEETPIVWVKNTPGIGDPNRSWVYAYEPCFFVNRGRPLVKPQAFNYLRYDTIPPGKKIHPTQKPDALLRHIISASCVPGEIVLDPFAGSGSTLVAANQLGCKFVGIEREDKFHRAAAERISEEIAAAEEVALAGDNADSSS